ncbi:MAG: ABC transporter permease [Planctomycetes bacterium]|nr:ABC transporter permease [Planctomycetota bacterium]
MSMGILAIGIAGTMMVFGLFNGLFLHPFPMPRQERLVDLDETAPKWNLEYTGLAYADFCAWREHNRSFESMYAWTVRGANLSLDGRAERINALVTTHDFFTVLGLRPVLGRCFTPEEDRPNGPKVVLLSTGLWERMAGRNPAILGQTLQLDGEYYTIIGVLPPAAAFPVDVDLWRPLAEDPQRRGGWYLSGVGRLREGVTRAQARDDLTRIHKGLIPQSPSNDITTPTVQPLRDRYLRDYRQGITILLGAVAFVLLIACCNVASIILARGTQRGKEIALRLALGAKSGHIMRQVLLESVVLSVAGAALGVPLGHAGLKLLLARLVEPGIVPQWLTFEPDIRWATLCLAVIGATTVLSGLIPALHAAHTRDLHAALQASSLRGTSSRSRRRVLSAIVVGQVALALTLLIGAGLVFRSFRKVQGIDPGFRTAGILTYQIALPYAAYADEAKRQAFFEQHVEKVRALPGVTHAGLVSAPPLSGSHDGRSFEVEGALQKAPGEQDPIVLHVVATPGYLETMGIKLLAGRFFHEQDNRPGGERTVIVNESFAKHFWPGQDPVDKRIRSPGSPDWMRVIGVTKDVKHYGLEQPMRPGVYVPYGQARSTGMSGVVRTQGDPLALIPAVREIVRTADAALPIYDVRTMVQLVRRSMVLRLIYSWMFTAFGAIAALMACAGIYGVVSYWVGQRTQEIGIRVALGARVPDVIRMVVVQGVRLVGIGLGLGLIGALALSRLLAGTLYGVRPTDPLTFAGVGLLLIAAGTLACYVPARRAARIDPMVALRYE